jgi:hypothetical protein
MERNGPEIFMPISACAGREKAKKLGSLAGLEFVSAHFDNHV